MATASNGDATGISAQADSNKYGNATVTNSGSITVTSNGDSGDAYGMYVESDGYGDIGITSTPGQGSRFAARFPASRVAGV